MNNIPDVELTFFSIGNNPPSHGSTPFPGNYICLHEPAGSPNVGEYGDCILMRPGYSGGTGADAWPQISLVSVAAGSILVRGTCSDSTNDPDNGIMAYADGVHKASIADGGTDWSPNNRYEMTIPVERAGQIIDIVGMDGTGSYGWIWEISGAPVPSGTPTNDASMSIPPGQEVVDGYVEYTGIGRVGEPLPEVAGAELTLETGQAAPSGQANQSAAGAELALETGLAVAFAAGIVPGWYLRGPQGQLYQLINHQGRPAALQKPH